MKVYATWLDYNKITNMGTDTRELIYEFPQWLPDPAGKYVQLTTPMSSKQSYVMNWILGGVQSGITLQPWGARPAFNYFRITIQLIKKDNICLTTATRHG